MGVPLASPANFTACDEESMLLQLMVVPGVTVMLAGARKRSGVQMRAPSVRLGDGVACVLNHGVYSAIGQKKIQITGACQ
ncbi:MAG: hypothetical protein JWR16_3353 [Nevskia sp.]|nr:hypothetical protein [Nevskia sp.]